MLAIRIAQTDNCFMELSNPQYLKAVVESIVVIALLGIVILSLLSLIFSYAIRSIFKKNPDIETSSNERDLNLSRIIGGLSILLFAYVTHQLAVQLPALFIGGLIIASENFLVNLAGIFKSSKEGVSDLVNNYNLQSPNEKRINKLSELQEEGDIDIKIDSEKEDLIEKKVGSDLVSIENNPVNKLNDDEFKTQQNQENAKKRIKDKLLKQQVVENLVLDKIDYHIRSTKELLQRYVKISPGGLYDHFFDAIIIERATNKVICAIEVKFTNRLSTAQQQYVEKMMHGHDGSTNLVIAVVFERYDKQALDQFLEFRKQVKQSQPTIGILIYQLDKSGFIDVLEIINDLDLELTSVHRLF